jgi:hypothetical protein
VQPSDHRARASKVVTNLALSTSYAGPDRAARSCAWSERREVKRHVGC